MNSLFTLYSAAWQDDLSSDQLYQVGNAAGWLSRGDKQASTSYPLSGRLYLAKSGWLLLSVPNALVRGVFDALTAPGAELPLAGTMNVPNVEADVLNAHISVMTADEVASIGANKINERGHHFGYSLGPVHEIDAKNIDGVSKVWAIQVASPALAALRKSYGLSPLPKSAQPFHITVAVRRKNVLGNNDVSKFDTPTSRGELKAAAEAPWATFVVVPHETGYAATTRPTGDGKFGLPGGKLEPGEDPLAAVQREAKEEGWDVSDVHPEPLHKSDVDGKPVWWYRAAAAKLLKDFKEKGRVVPSTARADQLTEFGNDKALQLYQAALKTAAEKTAVETNKQLTDEELTTVYKKLGFLPTHPELNLPPNFYALDPSATGSLKATKAATDRLRGGEADNVPDNKFPKSKLQAGAEHEHEHTNNDQVAKEIAKDHLSEDTQYYQKQEIVENAQPQVLKQLLAAKEHSDARRYAHKAAILRQLMTQAPQEWIIDQPNMKYRGVTHQPTGFKFHTHPTMIPAGVKTANSVYMNQLRNSFVTPNGFQYDHTKPVFENIRNHMFRIKQQGDWILQARRNHQLYRSALDPAYRQQLALQAFHGTMPQPAYIDQIIERYGGGLIGGK